MFYEVIVLGTWQADSESSSKMGLNVGQICCCVSPHVLLNLIVACMSVDLVSLLRLCVVANSYCWIGVPHLYYNNC